MRKLLIVLVPVAASAGAFLSQLPRGFSGEGAPIGTSAVVYTANNSGSSASVLDGDTLQANLNVVGRVFYAASTQICVQAAMSQGKTALGAQAGEARLGAILAKAGFTRFRRATATPFNLILEAQP